MIRVEFAEKLSRELKVTEAKADLIIKAFYHAIIKGVVEEGRVMIQNFGVFELRERPARKVYNPHTGERTRMAAMKRPWFHPSINLNREVNNAQGQSHKE